MLYKLKLWWNNPAENLWFTPALGAVFAIFLALLHKAILEGFFDNIIFK